MVNDKEIILMTKFLQRNYPISRIKYNTRFKRGLIINGAIILLSTQEDRIQLIKPMTNILTLVFGCSYDIAKSVIKNYYQITTP